MDGEAIWVCVDAVTDGELGFVSYDTWPASDCGVTYSCLVVFEYGYWGE